MIYSNMYTCFLTFAGTRGATRGAHHSLEERVEGLVLVLRARAEGSRLKPKTDGRTIGSQEENQQKTPLANIRHIESASTDCGSGWYSAYFY